MPIIMGELIRQHLRMTARTHSCFRVAAFSVDGRRRRVTTANSRSGSNCPVIWIKDGCNCRPATSRRFRLRWTTAGRCACPSNHFHAQDSKECAVADTVDLVRATPVITPAGVVPCNVIEANQMLSRTPTLMLRQQEQPVFEDDTHGRHQSARTNRDIVPAASTTIASL
jgi:hypothetical protein